MRIYWFAYRQLLPVNIPISAVLSIANPTYYPFVFATFGYFCTAFLYQYFYRNSWILYLNIGYSKSSMLLGTFFINLFFGLLGYAILWTVL